MKYNHLILLIGLLLLFSSQSYAQFGIVPVGGDINTENGTCSFSVGQPADASSYQETFSHSDRRASFNEGIQQPYLSWELLDIKDVVPLAATIKIYPNPTIESFSIKVEDYDQPLRYILYSINGQILQQGTMQNLQRIQIKSYPVGSYMLRVSTMDNKQENNYKIIKGH